MDLIINNKIIEAPITTIIEKLRSDSGCNYFNMIGKDGKEHLQIQCPFHKAGQERNMSASFYNESDNDEVEYGFFKCFTCGKKLPLFAVVNHCFKKELNDDFGKEWLVDNFGNIIQSKLQLPPLKEKKVKNKIILDESVLNDFNYIHPYMYKRKLTDDIIAKFKVGYDKDTDCITFPCWDINNNLVAINRRSISGKRFELVSNVNKEVYLLNFCAKENASTVYLVESQINCLNLWTYGYRAAALLGTGGKHQYEILNRCGFNTFILCLDGDEAGRNGTLRLINNLKDCMIFVKDIPDGKDVNDLTSEEFQNLPLLTTSEWCKKYKKKIS